MSNNNKTGPIAERSKLSVDLDHGGGDPGSNPGGPIGEPVPMKFNVKRPVPMKFNWRGRY